MNRMTRVPDRVVKLERELRAVFATRLESLVVYDLHETTTASGGSPHGAHAPAPTTHTLVIVKSLSESDLKSCADLVAAWQDGGLATPLLLTPGEFERSLDPFPLGF